VVLADNRSVSNAQEFSQVAASVKQSGRPSVLLLIQRDGRNIPVALPFESKK
jgi:serine protease Do